MKKHLWLIFLLIYSIHYTLCNSKLFGRFLCSCCKLMNPKTCSTTWTVNIAVKNRSIHINIAVRNRSIQYSLAEKTYILLQLVFQIETALTRWSHNSTVLKLAILSNYLLFWLIRLKYLHIFIYSSNIKFDALHSF